MAARCEPVVLLGRTSDRDVHRGQYLWCRLALELMAEKIAQKRMEPRPGLGLIRRDEEPKAFGIQETRSSGR